MKGLNGCECCSGLKFLFRLLFRLPIIIFTSCLLTTLQTSIASFTSVMVFVAFVALLGKKTLSVEIPKRIKIREYSEKSVDSIARGRL